MKRPVRLTILVTAILALASFAMAGDNLQRLAPEIEVHQTGGLPGYASLGGPIAVDYEIRVYNPSSEPITLTRVNLQSISPVTSYRLRNDSRPFEVTIAPDSAEIVTYRALVYARGGVIGSMTPVNLKGVVYFDSETGGFARAFTHKISPFSQKTDS